MKSSAVVAVNLAILMLVTGGCAPPGNNEGPGYVPKEVEVKIVKAEGPGCTLDQFTIKVWRGDKVIWVNEYTEPAKIGMRLAVSEDRLGYFEVLPANPDDPSAPNSRSFTVGKWVKHKEVYEIDLTCIEVGPGPSMQGDDPMGDG